MLAVVLVLATLSLVFSFLQPSMYRGEAKVLLRPRASESLFDPTSGARPDPVRALQTEIEVLKSEPVREAVRQRIGRAPDLSAAPIGQTDVIQISAYSNVPSEAA